MRILKIGMPLSLEVHKDDDVEGFRCKIVDFNEKYLYIDYPINNQTGRTGFFMEGTEFKASFVGKDQSVYWFETEVVARKKMNIPVIALTFPGIDQLIRVQRRRYVRVDSSVDVAITGEDMSFTAVTHDISGGGLAFAKPLHANINERQHVELTFVLPMNSGEYFYVETEGMVVRVIEENRNQPSKVSIEFDQLLQSHQQKIIQFCFEQQMHMRKKGLK